MDPNLRNVYKHMIGLGLGALAHANAHAAYWDYEAPYWAELSVLQAAHAAEILIKARIAQEHPLLIFEKLPGYDGVSETGLNFRSLIEKGRTVDYRDLPDRLWSTTGMKIDHPDIYQSYGRLRNAIQHFAIPEGEDMSHRVLEFIFKVIDPFINRCWKHFAIDHNEDTEGVVYLVPVLIKRQIEFLVSPEVIKQTQWIDFPWDDDSPYRRTMQERIEAARSGRYGVNA